MRAPTEKVFIGRDAELEHLMSLVSETAGGEGHVVLLAGEPGIGKTSLAERLCRLAPSEVHHAWARCWEGGGAPAFWPWTQLLAALRAEPLPEIDSESEQARFVLFDAIAERLRTAAEQHPRLLVLEDLHVADVASLQLLRFLVDALHGVGVLLVGTYRDSEVDESTGVGALLSEIGRRGEVIRLEGLEGSAIRDLLAKRAGRGPTSAAVDLVLEVTGGNALFADEFVRLLVREDLLDDLNVREQIPIPGSVRAALAVRLEGLPGRTQEVLRRVAVLGRDINARVAARIDADADEALAAAVSEGILRQTSSGWRFAHVLFQAVLYESLAPRERAALHSLAGEAIEETAEPDAEQLARLAHHFSRASAGAAARARDYAIAAGDQAMRSLAFEDAARHYGEALELRAGMTDELLSQMLVSLGVAEMRAGHIAAGRTHVQEAWDIAWRLDSDRLIAEAALAYGRPSVEGGVVNADVVRVVGNALERAPDLPSRVLLRSRLANELMFAPEYEQREALARTALEEAAGVDDRTRAWALRWAQAALGRPETTEERLWMLTEVVDLGHELDDLDARATGLAVRAAQLVELGRPAELAADVLELDRIASRVPAPLYRWFSQANATRIALMRGEFSAAETLMGQALEQAGEVPNALSAWFNQQLYVRWERGGLTDFEALFPQLGDTRPQLHLTMACGRAWVWAEEQRLEEARSHLRRLVQNLERHPRGTLWMLDLGWMAQTAHLTGDTHSAPAIYEALLPFADRHHHAAVQTCAVYWGSVQRSLGNLAGVMGRWDEAAERAETALTAQVWMGAFTFAPRSQFELATALMQTGDVGRAQDLLAEAREQAQRLGLTRLCEQIERAAAAPAPRHPASARTDTCRATLEGEYWSLACGDRTTRLKDSKGVRHLLHLLGAPGRPVHALELVAAVEGASRAPTAAAAAAVAEGTLGQGADDDPLLDRQAAAEYRARIAELQEEVEEAEAFNDPERVARAREELEFIEDELRRAMGLGGRARQLNRTAAEQARVNVTKTIRSTLKRIDSSDPELARHLRAAIRTGSHCCYGTAVELPREWRIG